MNSNILGNLERGRGSMRKINSRHIFHKTKIAFYTYWVFFFISLRSFIYNVRVCVTLHHVTT